MTSELVICTIKKALKATGCIVQNLIVKTGVDLPPARKKLATLPDFSFHLAGGSATPNRISGVELRFIAICRDQQNQSQQIGWTSFSHTLVRFSLQHRRISEQCNSVLEGSSHHDLLFSTILCGTVQPVTFAHGNSPSDRHIVGIMDDTVHDCFRDRAIAFRVRIDSSIPTFRFVLGAEDHRSAGSLPTSGFHDFQ